MKVMKEEDIYKTILMPHVSEKATMIAEKVAYHAFKVAKTATKIEIKQAVEALFSVKVDKVQVLNVKGKQKRFGRFQGRRSDWKKAYVKLAPGYEIDLSNS